MIHTHANKGLVWLDVESPQEEEIAGLIKRYGLHPLVGEELKTSTSNAKIDFYKEYIVIVLKLPVRTRSGKNYEIKDREVDFIIGKNFLITCRYDTIEQLEYFSKVFEANTILNKNEKIEHAGHLFYYMVSRIYSGMREDLENIRDSLITAESKIFNGEERKMVEAISNISRELIDFKQTARVHREIWEQMLEHGATELFGSDYSSYIGDIHDEFSRINDLIVNARELLADLRETNDSLVDTKQNETIRILTLVAFFFSPLTFIAAVFTIPAAKVPIIHSSSGWLMILFIMLAFAGAIWYFFKKHKWI